MEIKDPEGIVSTDALEEAAYLVERRVRPLALCGSVRLRNEIERMRLIQRLNEVSINRDIKQFIVQFPDGTAHYGYASAGWVLDLYRWMLSADVPNIQRERISGLLFGYGVDSISRFEELSNDRVLFARSNSESPVIAST